MRFDQQRERGALLFGVLGEDVALHDGQLLAEELVLGPAQPHTLGAEESGKASVFARIDVGAHREVTDPDRVGPLEQLPELIGHVFVAHFELTEKDLAAAAIERHEVAFAHHDLADDHGALAELDVDRATNCGNSPTARDNGGVRRQAPARSENAVREAHRDLVGRAGLGAGEDHLLTAIGGVHRVLGREVDAPRRRTR